MKGSHLPKAFILFKAYKNPKLTKIVARRQSHTTLLNGCNMFIHGGSASGLLIFKDTKC